MYNISRSPKGAICNNVTLQDLVEFRFNFSFQEAALLLSLMAAKLRRESGDNVEEGSLASELEKLVVEHIIISE